MKTSAVLLSFVLLQVGSDAWPVDSSSLSLSESPLSAEQLADKEYKDQKLDEYSIAARLDIIINH